MRSDDDQISANLLCNIKNRLIWMTNPDFSFYLDTSPAQTGGQTLGPGFDPPPGNVWTLGNDLSGTFERRRIMKAISQLTGHTIICGASPAVRNDSAPNARPVKRPIQNGRPMTILRRRITSSITCIHSLKLAESGPPSS